MKENELLRFKKESSDVSDGDIISKVEEIIAIEKTNNNQELITSFIDLLMKAIQLATSRITLIREIGEWEKPYRELKKYKRSIPKEILHKILNRSFEGFPESYVVNVAEPLVEFVEQTNNTSSTLYRDVIVYKDKENKLNNEFDILIEKHDIETVKTMKFS